MIQQRVASNSGLTYEGDDQSFIDVDDLSTDNEFDIELEQEEIDRLHSMPYEEDVAVIMRIIRQMLPKYNFLNCLCLLEEKIQNQDRLKKPLPLRIPPPNSNYTQQLRKYLYKHRLRSPVLKEEPRNSKDNCQDEQLSQRQVLQRKVAYVFVEQGYSVCIMRDALQQEVDNALYNSLVTSILRSAVRKLIDVLNKQLRLNVEPLSGRDEMEIRSSMANCRKWMTPLQLRVLFTIIKVLYGFENPPVFPADLLALYVTINKKLGKRLYCNLFQKLNKYRAINIGWVQLDEKQQPFFEVKKEETGQSRLVDKEIARGQLQRNKQILEMFIDYGHPDRIAQFMVGKYHNLRQVTPLQVYEVIEKAMLHGLTQLKARLEEMGEREPLVAQFRLSEATIRRMLLDRNSNSWRMGVLRLLNECQPLTRSSIRPLMNHINNYNTRKKYNQATAKTSS